MLDRFTPRLALIVGVVVWILAIGILAECAP